jgi:outer membrane protein OmpA-like peptidoglycan-associated protein
MKKILFMFVALFATITSFAQTVTSSNIFENTYISVSGGGYGWINPTNNGYDNFIESVRPSASIRVGKFITPTFGFELDGSVGMANRDKFVENTNLSLNGLFNVTNMFTKYQGKPKSFEVVPFVGVGWLRTYGTVTNNMSSKGGIQFNWNLGKSDAWQINVIPSITYALTNNGSGEVSEIKFNANRAFVSLQAGVTYKFKNKKGTHNFVLCPFSVTQSEKDELNKLLAERSKTLAMTSKLLDKRTNELNKTKRTVALQEAQIDSLLKRKMVVEAPIAIGFEIGRAEVSKTQMASLVKLAKTLKENDSNITIVGFADAQTGSMERNQELSEARANAVAEILKSMGVNADKITTKGFGSSQQIFEDNDMNRVVIFNN